VPGAVRVTLLVLWEGLVRGLNVSAGDPAAALGHCRAPSRTSLPILWGDFVQTFLKGALTGLS
jgi:NitT/TauT family transport system permease protein